MNNANKRKIELGTQIMVITAFGQKYPGVVNKLVENNGKKWFEVTWNFMDFAPRTELVIDYRVIPA